MRCRTCLVMVAWLFLFGCDDDDDNKGKSITGTPKGQQVMQVLWDTPGCSGKVEKGIVIDQNGNRGKVTISWDYVPAFLAVLFVLSLVMRAQRYDRSRC